MLSKFRQPDKYTIFVSPLWFLGLNSIYISHFKLNDKYILYHTHTHTEVKLFKTKGIYLSCIFL